MNRANFKRNFLKKVIFRLDYQGVFQSEMDEILSKVKPVLKKSGFNRYEKRINNGIAIHIDNNMYDMNDKNIKQEINGTVIHSFINENKGFVLDLSNSFVCINVNNSKYVPFEEYRDILMDISKVYQENIDFFTVKRLGLRKINQCMIIDKKSINDYFKDKYFNFFSLDDKTQNLFVRKTESFIADNHKYNLTCLIEQGKLNETSLYNVTLDIDIYMDETDEIADVINDSNKMNDMNRCIFDIYVDTLTDSFKNNLTSEDEFDDKNVIGVEEND